jgi:formylglycine-generating enzyme required for sulfatase activity
MNFRFLLALALVALPVVVFAAQTDPTPAVTAAPATNADWTPVTKSLNGIDSVLVPAGTFTIGTSKEDVDLLFADCETALGKGNCQYEWFDRETPQSEITFTSPFWISRTEITNAQYAECVTAGACTPPSDTTAFADPAFSDYPVVYITWEQANQYADSVGARLPNEAEWEYAARGVDSLVYPWGSDFDPAQANFCDTPCPRDWRAFDADDGYPELAPVGSYPGSSWVGALDLSGNAAEWTLSMYEESLYRYPYTSDDGRNDRVTDRLDARIVRGGSWESVQRDTRAAARTAVPYPQDGTGAIGFRVVTDYTP